MAYAPEPIRFVGQQASEGRYLAEPYIIIGTLPAGSIAKAATVAAAAGTVGATYTATEQATILNLQTQLNALITSLKNAGFVA